MWRKPAHGVAVSKKSGRVLCEARRQRYSSLMSSQPSAANFTSNRAFFLQYVERLFSREGFIHDSYRNRLGGDILTALVRSCMNRNAFDDEPLLMSELLAGADSASSDSD